MLTIVATDVAPATERILAYLANYGVPINVAMFRYFRDGDRSDLARTWLLPENLTSDTTNPRRKAAKEPWNGQDWYLSFGEESGIRSWDDARRYGFVSAGGGEWYSRSLRALPIGARIVYIPRVGYVGVGTVSGNATPFDDAALTVDAEQRKITDLDLNAGYRHAGSSPDNDEYIVPVEWTTTVDRENAVQEKGLFANQHSVCKLRNRFTLETRTRRFGLEE